MLAFHCISGALGTSPDDSISWKSAVIRRNHEPCGGDLNAPNTQVQLPRFFPGGSGLQPPRDSRPLCSHFAQDPRCTCVAPSPGHLSGPGGAATSVQCSRSRSRSELTRSPCTTRGQKAALGPTPPRTNSLNKQASSSRKHRRRLSGALQPLGSVTTCFKTLGLRGEASQSPPQLQARSEGPEFKGRVGLLAGRAADLHKSQQQKNPSNLKRQ